MAEKPHPPRVEKVLVIGAGVSGLTTALELARVRENGKPRYHVQVVAERPADKTVSVIAGALWEFPPAVCGQHGNQLSIMRSKRWSVESYKEFRKLSPQAGVHMVTSNFYFGVKIEDDWPEHTKMRELEKLSEEEEIHGFRRMTQEDLKKVPASFGVKDGYQLQVPVVDTPIYTRWLREQLKQQSNVTVTYGKRITDRLVPQSAKIRKDWDVDAIVNCTGMGAAELAGACMVPLRGALVRVPVSRWASRPKTAYAISKTAHQQDMVFIVPRETHLILGGLVEPSEYDTHIGKDYQPVKDMFDRCKRFAPELLKDVELSDTDVDVIAGLRPYRVENVCVEKEYGFNIVHNFGHGGSGFSLSYGCAREAIGLLESMEGPSFRVVDLPPAALHHHPDTYTELDTPAFPTIQLDGQQVSVEHPVYN
ncbi:FAD-dependent oxidoreductase [Streptomyces sp. NPDC057854]|uniref:FAD-dependent oxidoreductase n=1 Tax=unclassified Streptomyces TaxID=2593676 RepID=UPI003677C328